MAKFIYYAVDKSTGRAASGWTEKKRVAEAMAQLRSHRGFGAGRATCVVRKSQLLAKSGAKKAVVSCFKNGARTSLGKNTRQRLMKSAPRSKSPSRPSSRSRRR